jgi:hypothetical protein
VALKHGGEVYALDMASSQYGYYEPIMPWMISFRARENPFAGSALACTQRTHKEIEDQRNAEGNDDMDISLFPLYTKASE